MADQLVYVGLSGGVDSSVSAALLKDQGYKVVGVYMKNWAQDLPGFECPWREDLADAKRIAVQLDIEFKIFDFQAEYKDKVVEYMLEAYKAGLTPNPDVMCNQEIKFRLFLDASIDDGADMIATGHYARIEEGKLLMAADPKKDQTYFLYRMPKDSLGKVLFPLGEMTKQRVREIADQKNLVTAQKSESMGICFVGKVGIKEFLSQFVETSPGSILSESGEVLGQHDGAIFYTIGQRHGLNISSDLPYYVVSKSIDDNTITVSSNIDNEKLWTSELALSAAHWLDGAPVKDKVYQVRTRHLGELISAKVDENRVVFKDPIRTVVPGQSVVVYDRQQVVGGGIVAKTL